MSRMTDILVVNPNTTVSMTTGLETIISQLASGSPDVTIAYYTASAGVPSINNAEDASLSATSVLPYLTSTSPSSPPAAKGYLIACYSDHPLVSQLKSHHPTKPIVGIFEASVSTSLLLISARQKFGIVSTGKVWEELLDDAVTKYLGAERSKRYAGTETTGLSATDLHDAPAAEVREKMKEATKRLLRKGEVGAVCLGCAGMVGMEEMVREACVEELGQDEGGKVHIIDGVKSGYAFLEGVVRATRLKV